MCGDKFVKVNEAGRRVGESHPRAVLTDHEVDLLLELLDYREEQIEKRKEEGWPKPRIDAWLREEQLSFGALAVKFEVCKSAVQKIAQGERRCFAVVELRPVPVKRKG